MPASRRTRGGRRRLFWAVLALVVLAIGLVVAEFLGRSIAQSELEARIEQQLPDGVSGHVDATIGGGLFLPQAISGRFSDIQLHSRDLKVGVVPLDVSTQLSGVQLGATPQAEHVRGTITLTPEAAAQAIGIPGVVDQLEFRDGQLAFVSELNVLGIPFGVDVIAGLGISNGQVMLDVQQTKAHVGDLSVDPSSIWPELGDGGLPVCAEEYLPSDIEVTGLEVRTSGIVASFSSDNLPLDEAHLSARGSCPAA